MPLIKDKGVRRHLSRIFRILKKRQGFCQIRLRELDEKAALARLNKAEIAREVNTHFSTLLSVAHCQIATLSSYYLAMFIDGECPLPKDWTGSKVDGNNILKHSLLHMINHALAVITLIERGYTNSARSLLRTLIEATWTTVAFCADRDKACQYVKGTDFEKSKKVWQAHFSPSQLINCLTKLETFSI